MVTGLFKVFSLLLEFGAEQREHPPHEPLLPRGIGSRDGGREAIGLVPRRGITVAGQCRDLTGFAHDNQAEA